jgi:REP element-mobilizing transposase RayT
MPVKNKIPYSEGIFFITFTCFQWLPLFEITNGYDLVYRWFDQLKKQGHYIIGYQIMPNHLHVVIAFRNCKKNINNLIGNGKRFMAYGIIERLEKSNLKNLLARLEQGVNRSDRKRAKKHEVWEDSFDWKICYSNKIICQKLDYMHHNSISGKWQLVKDPADYVHSSAGYYFTGKQGIYAVTHYMALEDIDLTT